MTLGVSEKLQDRVLHAISLAPSLSTPAAQRLAGYVNFVRPVARLPLQLVSTILQRDPALPRGYSQARGISVFPNAASNAHYH